MTIILKELFEKYNLSKLIIYNNDDKKYIIFDNDYSDLNMTINEYCSKYSMGSFQDYSYNGYSTPFIIEQIVFYGNWSTLCKDSILY